LVHFYQAYYTLVVHYCHDITLQVVVKEGFKYEELQAVL